MGHQSTESTQMLQKRPDFGVDAAEVVDTSGAATTGDTTVGIADCSAQVEVVGCLCALKALIEATLDSRATARGDERMGANQLVRAVRHGDCSRVQGEALFFA